MGKKEWPTFANLPFCFRCRRPLITDCSRAFPESPSRGRRHLPQRSAQSPVDWPVRFCRDADRQLDSFGSSFADSHSIRNHRRDAFHLVRVYVRLLLHWRPRLEAGQDDKWGRAFRVNCQALQPPDVLVLLPDGLRRPRGLPWSNAIDVRRQKPAAVHEVYGVVLVLSVLDNVYSFARLFRILGDVLNAPLHDVHGTCYEPVCIWSVSLVRRDKQGHGLGVRCSRWNRSGRNVCDIHHMDGEMFDWLLKNYFSLCLLLSTNLIEMEIVLHCLAGRVHNLNEQDDVSLYRLCRLWDDGPSVHCRPLYRQKSYDSHVRMYSHRLHFDRNNGWWVTPSSDYLYKSCEMFVNDNNRLCLIHCSHVGHHRHDESTEDDHCPTRRTRKLQGIGQRAGTEFSFIG